MILNDSWIIDFAARGGISPFKHQSVNPASLDVTLNNLWTTSAGGEYKCGGLTLSPNETVLAKTAEYFKMPTDVIGFLTLKSSLARTFLNHMNSNLINPGFEGNLVLEFHNCSNKTIFLEEGQRVSQIVFMQMSATPIGVYQGKHQGQK